MPERSGQEAHPAMACVGEQAAALNAAASGASGTRTPTKRTFTNRGLIAAIVYLALLLDNMLLTVIVPILPDYLATINNRTHYAEFESGNSGSGSGGALNVGLGVVGTFSTQNLAYRNFDSTAGAQAPMTKHPIPGKSMVNFSLLHLPDDKVILGPAEPKQQRHTVVASGNGVPKAVNTGNLSTGGGGSSNLSTFTTPATGPDSESLEKENGSIGILLSMKALVQLIFNPIVGNLSSKFGYRLPIVVGTFCLLVSSLVFSIADTYVTLLLARAVQGVGSACIGVCGMSLVAQHYPEEDRRSKVMGIILGSIALGVLLGYPFGGILYDLIGKSAPFIILSTIIFLTLGIQLLTMDLSVQPEVVVDIHGDKPKWRPLLESKMILAIVVAIWFSTSTMAILEPCLPIWLIQYLKPTKWQLGTVFIPDSLGYFVGTNFFGTIAYKYGQVKISCISLLLVGISSILIPSATTVTHLLLPHFGLGLGIGIIDAALVPLLATFVDATLTEEEQNATECDAEPPGGMSSYGTVYAIQQTSVSLAYCLAPLIGGELAQAFGFAWLMRIVGSVNMLYGPILVILYQKYDPKTIRERRNQMLLTTTGGRGSQYKQLYNSIDTE